MTEREAKLLSIIRGSSDPAALMLVTARLKYVADSEWGSRRYLDVSLLDE